MKAVAVFAVCVVFCVGLALSKPQDQDSLNITRLLNNDAIVRKQINCLLDRAPCDQIGTRLKKSIPEVVNRDCRACTPQQAKNARRLVTFIQQRDPQAWQQIQAKYRG